MASRHLLYLGSNSLYTELAPDTSFSDENSDSSHRRRVVEVGHLHSGEEFIFYK